MLVFQRIGRDLSECCPVSEGLVMAIPETEPMPETVRIAFSVSVKL